MVKIDHKKFIILCNWKFRFDAKEYSTETNKKKPFFDTVCMLLITLRFYAMGSFHKAVTDFFNKSTNHLFLWNLFVCFVILFNAGHVLQLRLETVAVRRRMRNGFGWLWWPNGIRGHMWPKFPDIHLTVEGKPRKKPQSGNWPDQDLNPGPLGERHRHYPSIKVDDDFYFYERLFIEQWYWFFSIQWSLVKITWQ